MDHAIELAAASRDGHLPLRRVERQQALIERLHAARGRRLRLGEVAREFGVSVRTVARDVERLRLSGVPLAVHQGRNGGVSLSPRHHVAPITFSLPEVAALMSSLTVLGPTASQSAASALHKLVNAMTSNTPQRGTPSCPTDSSA